VVLWGVDVCLTNELNIVIQTYESVYRHTSCIVLKECMFS